MSPRWALHPEDGQSLQKAELREEKGRQEGEAPSIATLRLTSSRIPTPENGVRRSEGQTGPERDRPPRSGPFSPAQGTRPKTAPAAANHGASPVPGSAHVILSTAPPAVSAPPVYRSGNWGRSGSGSARPNSHSRRGRPGSPPRRAPNTPSNLTGARATTFSTTSFPHPTGPSCKVIHFQKLRENSFGKVNIPSLRRAGAAVRGEGTDTKAGGRGPDCRRARQQLPPRGKRIAPPASGRAEATASGGNRVLTGRRPDRRVGQVARRDGGKEAGGWRVAGPRARGDEVPDLPRSGARLRGGSRGQARRGGVPGPRPQRPRARPSACAAHPSRAASLPRTPRSRRRSPRRAPGAAPPPAALRRREAREPPGRTAASSPDSSRGPAGKALTPAAKVQRPTQVRPGRAVSLGNGAHARTEDSGKCSPQSLSALLVRKGRFPNRGLLCTRIKM